ncbi:MAG: YigZ family protein [Lachnospiraceae bacterium]|nr:YigZ family protein [Lachnospiraceae bacterium]
MDEWYTLYKGGTGEIEEKKSRFIATIMPVSSEEEAVSFIAGLKKQYWDARHNCSAFVIGKNGEKTRCSDDGEPSGTAGRPMLDVLTGQHVTNVCAVVTRYFGGTLLGTGGLVRAYSAAVRAGLENCEIIKKINGHTVKVICDYNDIGKLQNLAARKGYHITDTDYGEKVTAVFMTESAQELERDITDATSGKALIEDVAPVVYAMIDGEPKAMT